MKQTFNRGFTLIEMLIVIAVISILAGIVLIGVTGLQSSARDTTRIGNLRTAQQNVESYYLRMGSYPDVSDWESLGTELETAQVIADSDKLPKDPGRSGAQVEYDYATTDGYDYILVATLENSSNSLNDDSAEIDDGSAFGVDCTDANFKYCIGSS